MTIANKPSQSKEVVQQNCEILHGSKHSLSINKKGVKATGLGVLSLTLILVIVLVLTWQGVDFSTFTK